MAPVAAEQAAEKRLKQRARRKEMCHPIRSIPGNRRLVRRKPSFFAA